MQDICDYSRVSSNSTVPQEDYTIVQEVVTEQPFDETFVRTARWANHIWLLGVSLWGIGIVSRAAIALTDCTISLVEFCQLLAASIIFLSCLCFKPIDGISSSAAEYSLSRFGNYQEFDIDLSGEYLGAVKARMTELKNHHMISQEYVFPFPYLCQIYHLLNLKHLEDVHSFSLSNLKILKINEFHRTDIGGAMKFETVLESPMNTLRIWRQPVVEVDLILHTPYTVELSIPAYDDKRIIVMFNVFPISEREHKLFIDIYSNLQWPKPILQMLLHVAACLTVFEDFPYLRKLATRNLERLVRSPRMSNHETMLLFKRFAELYGQRVNQPA